jgi:hypothetical protein
MSQLLKDIAVGVGVVVSLAWLGKKMDRGFWKIVRERRVRK